MVKHTYCKRCSHSAMKSSRYTSNKIRNVYSAIVSCIIAVSMCVTPFIAVAATYAPDASVYQGSNQASTSSPRDVSGYLSNLKISIHGDGEGHESANTVRPLYGDDNDGTKVQTLAVTVKFDADAEDINPGDYFDLKLSNNLNAYGATKHDANIVSHLYVGVDSIADSVYNSKTNTFRYTFNKNVKDCANFFQTFTEPLFIDRDHVPNNASNVKLVASIGEKSDEKTVNVDYALPAHDQKDINSNGVDNTQELDEENGNFTQVVYVNYKRKPQNNTEITIENCDNLGGNTAASKVTFDNQVLNSIKVYRVKDPDKLNKSFSLNYENLDQLDNTKFTTSLQNGGVMKISLQNGSSSDIYVITYKGKYDNTQSAAIKTTFKADPISSPSSTSTHVSTISLKDRQDANKDVQGRFMEFHIYQSVDAEGKVVSIDEYTDVTNFQTGTSREQYTTEKQDKTGYTLYKVKPNSKDAKFDNDGKRAVGNFLPNKALVVTYYYKRTGEYGYFRPNHIYQTIDENNTVVSTDFTEHGDKTKGKASETFSEQKKDREGYTFDHVVDVNNAEKNNDSVSGNYQVGKTLQATFYYYKRVVLRGTFQETHVYVTKDQHGKELSRETIVEAPSSGTADQKYTTGKKEKDDFKFVKTENPVENPQYDSTNGNDTKGNYEVGKHKKITYVYEKTQNVPDPVPPKVGTFQETHVYVTKDQHGKELSRETIVEAPSSGTADQKYTTGKKEKDDFKFVKTENPVENPQYDSTNGNDTKGNYEVGKHKKITYVYEKTQNVSYPDCHKCGCPEPKPNPEPKPAPEPDPAPEPKPNPLPVPKHDDEHLRPAPKPRTNPDPEPPFTSDHPNTSFPRSHPIWKQDLEEYAKVKDPKQNKVLEHDDSSENTEEDQSKDKSSEELSKTGASVTIIAVACTIAAALSSSVLAFKKRGMSKNSK